MLRPSARAGLLAACLLLQACMPRALLVRSAADQLAMQAQAPEDDLFLVRDASPFYLKLSESVLRETPGHLPLAAAVAGGYAQYAYAFVAFEAEKLTSSDVRAAHRLEVRAAALYRRALNHAFGALELRQPSLRNLLRDPHSKATIRPDEVAVAYWAAAAWGALISLSKDSPEVVADLPSAQRLASLAWSTEPRHDRGALATLMGSLEASRPGGNLLKARDYFDQAVLLGGEAAAGPYVAMAETLALPVHDRQAYEAWLVKAQSVAVRHPNVANDVMRERANWLLETIDERF